MTLICKRCENKFEAVIKHGKRPFYCTDCKKEKKRQWQYEYQSRENKKLKLAKEKQKKSKEKPKISIAEINEKAQKKITTYGKITAPEVTVIVPAGLKTYWERMGSCSN